MTVAFPLTLHLKDLLDTFKRYKAVLQQHEETWDSSGKHLQALKRRQLRGDLINPLTHVWRIQIVGRVSGDHSSCCPGGRDTFTF